MADQNKWTRREFTTRGADPTVVVEWTASNGLKLQEFQGVVIIAAAPKATRPEHDDSLDGLVDFLATELHTALEAHHTDAQNARDFNEFMATGGEDIAAAERRAGWDPKP